MYHQLSHTTRLKMVDAVTQYTAPSRRSLLANLHTFLRYTHECNFINAHEKNTTSRGPIFTKLRNCKQNYVQSPCTECCPSLSKSVHSVERNLFRPLRKFGLRSAHTVYLCVLCGSQNKQRLFPYTALTGWFL
jgi:hypothetical protein